MKNEARLNLIAAADQLRLAQDRYNDCLQIVLETNAKHKIGEVIETKTARSGETCRAKLVSITARMMRGENVVCIDYVGHKLNRDGSEGSIKTLHYDFVNLNEVL